MKIKKLKVDYAVVLGVLVGAITLMPFLTIGSYLTIRNYKMVLNDDSNYSNNLVNDMNSNTNDNTIKINKEKTQTEENEKVFKLNK